MAKNNLNYKTKNFKDFVLGYNTSLNIPYYQRQFVWSEDKNKYVLIKFYRDIFDQFQEDPDVDYFIGTFATCKSAINEIVDGQQRFTSLAIFIKILSKYTGTNVDQYFYDSNNNFVISNNCELRADLEFFLFNKGSRNPLCPINTAISIATDEAKKIVNKLTTQQLKDFEKYLLNSVKMSYIEFVDPKSALKYFLNINSLSIKLTEAEIFYAYFSQLIQATRSNTINIENIRNIVRTLDEKFKKALGEDDIIYIFLKAYFKKDPFISYLGDGKKETLEIGRWLTGYKMDLLSDMQVAVDFTTKFVDYISDLNQIAIYLIDGSCFKFKHIYLNYLLNNYTKYKHTKTILECMFKNRHPYNRDFKETMYNNGQLDMVKLDSFFKLVNATLIKNFIEGKKNLTENMESNTELKQISAYTILNGLAVKNIFNFNYPVDKESKINLSDDKVTIHLILSIQEAYLNYMAIPSLTMNSVLAELLDTNKFTIEHLYSKKDFRDSTKFNDWKAIGIFKNDYEFDTIRSSFRNLSLISRNENSALGANVIAKKISSYKSARGISLSNEPEYLIQSFVDGSDFYNNSGLSKIGLPERKIVLSANMNTWSHSVNNDIFIEKLTELAVKELFK